MMSSSVGLQLRRKRVLPIYKIFYELGPKLPNSYLMAIHRRLSKHNYGALLPNSDENIGCFLLSDQTFE